MQLSEISESLEPNCLKKTWKAIRFFATLMGHVFTDSELKAAVWPAFAAVVIHDLHQDKTFSSEQRWLATMILWQVFSLFGFWVQYNLIAKRSHGEADTHDIAAGTEQAPFSTAAMLTHSSTEFADGFMTGFAFNPTIYSPASLGLSFTLGVASWMEFMLSDALAAYTMYIKDTRKANLAKQNGCKWLYKHAKYIAIFLREAYSPMLGALHAYCFLDVLLYITGYEQASAQQKNIITAVASPLLLLIYAGSARAVNGFYIRLMHKNLKTIDLDIDVLPVLCRPKRPRGLRFVGDLTQGFILDDLAKSCGQSNQAAANLAVFFNALGLSALGIRGLREYVFSTSADQGKLSQFLFGPQEAVSMAHNGAELIESGFAVLMGMTQAWAMRGENKAAIKQRQELLSDPELGPLLENT